MARVLQLLFRDGNADPEPLHIAEHFQGLHPIRIPRGSQAGAAKILLGHSSKGVAWALAFDPIVEPGHPYRRVSGLISAVHHRLIGKRTPKISGGRSVNAKSWGWTTRRAGSRGSPPGGTEQRRPPFKRAASGQSGPAAGAGEHQGGALRLPLSWSTRYRRFIARSALSSSHQILKFSCSVRSAVRPS